MKEKEKKRKEKKRKKKKTIRFVLQAKFVVDKGNEKKNV